MEFLNKLSKFLLYSFLCFLILVGLIMLYGQIEQYAGFLLLFTPIAAPIGGLILMEIKKRRPNINIFLFLLASVGAAIAGFVIIMILAYIFE